MSLVRLAGWQVWQVGLAGLAGRSGWQVWLVGRSGWLEAGVKGVAAIKPWITTADIRDISFLSSETSETVMLSAM